MPRQLKFCILSLAVAVSLGRAQPASPFVSGAWSGNVTPTSATVNIRLTAPGLRVRLALGTTANLSPVVFFGSGTTAAVNGNIISVNIDGLKPNTDYYYGMEVQGVLRTEAISRGHFHTFPQGAASFKLAFASCSDYHEPDQRAFDAILAEQPLLFVHMGDLHYNDTNTTNPDDYLRNYDAVLNHPSQGAFYRDIPIAYMWDDHDFTGDNSDGTAIGAATARAVYREYAPHYPITVTGGTIAQSFTIGRVRVIMTDLRSASSPPTLPESPTKTRLGALQKAWFKQELISARDAGFPLILWVSTDPWIDRATVGADTWGGHATERTELANFIKDNRIKNLVLLSGDMHALAYDDGTHSDYASGGGAPLVVLQAAALAREANVKGGPYSAGPFPGTTQYGVLEITDTGGAVVQCRFTGHRVDEGAKLVFRFNASAALVDVNPRTGADVTTDRALVNLSTRVRLSTPTDTLIAGFVISGNTPRNILLRAAGPSLAAFGIADFIPRPVVALYQGQNIIASNDDWSLGDLTRLSAAFDRVGAFRFASITSRDAALLITLLPGAYTVQVSDKTARTGVTLAEVYEVP